MSARLGERRTLGLLALAAFLIAFPFFASTFWVVSIGIKTLWLGIAAISLIFLAGTVGMVSLAQTAIYGSAGYVLAHLTVTDGDLGLGVKLEDSLGHDVSSAVPDFIELIFLFLANFVFYVYGNHWFLLCRRRTTEDVRGSRGMKKPLAQKRDERQKAHVVPPEFDAVHVSAEASS